ncbi:NosD domain-containing protein [Glycomyces sp. NPDC046736]|uniref:NosD domain-containing protein n=1 Tax=Glycomyces sp. NPDC046736 TaxID=3155615 RepID=UPI0033CB475B
MPPTPRRAIPLRPRPERRLPMLAFMTCVLAALTLSCYLGGLAIDARVAQPESFPALAEAEPPAYRSDGPRLLVCTEDATVFTERNEGVNYNDRIANERTYEDCLAEGHRDLASAVAAAEPGTNIAVLPGRYTVDETILVETADLQIEGLGDSPDDVQITARFNADFVLNGYATTGLYLKGIAFGQAGVAALRLAGVQGAALDTVSAFQSEDSGLLVEDSIGVALNACRATQADGAGIRIAFAQAEITGCEATGNSVGLEITGDNVNAVATANRLHGNATGLVVADTGTNAEITAADNLLYGNNAEYDRTAACGAEPAKRDWGSGVRCPDTVYPSGIGLLVAGATDTTATGNRIWNQQTAAIATWGAPGQATGLGGDRNAFTDNIFGIREDNQRERNRLDLWWDGVGVDNCFDEPQAHRTAPSVLPGCDSGVSRAFGDPLRTLKVWQCGIGGTEVPEGCDWYGAQFTSRIEFQAAVVFAAALLFLTGAGWLGAARSPNPPRAGQMTFSALGTGAGVMLFVLAVWSGRADYEALAISMWGFGWLLAGRSWYRCGARVFGSFTAMIGLAALLDAFDRGVRSLVIMPVSPAWIWLAMLPIWTLVVLGVAFGPRRREHEPAPVERTPVTARASDSFDW